MTLIVWNGSDSYIELSEAPRYGYTIWRGKLYSHKGAYDALEATQVDPVTLPLVNGEIDFSGILATETGNYYRGAQ